MGDSHYQYEPLAAGQLNTRLLVLHPGHKWSRIRCSLRTAKLPPSLSAAGTTHSHSIKSESLCPLYDALSYTWGDTRASERILVNDCLFPVTRNLKFVLRSLRNTKKPRTMWIDAICINQQDLVERSYQVTMMRDIYKHAQQVILWLGPGATMGRFSYRWFLYPLWNMILVNRAYPLTLEEQVRKTKAFIQSSRRARHGCRTFVSHALAESWWERVWIIQEVAVSANAIVHWGKTRINFEVLSSIAAPIEIAAQDLVQSKTMETAHIPEFRNLVALRRLYRLSRLYRHDEPVLQIDTLLQAFRGSKATDSRDKVFALIGLLREPQHPLLTVDYSKAIRDVYRDATLYSILTSKSLDIICLSESEPGLHGLSSWVPDWSSTSIHGLWPSVTRPKAAKPSPLVACYQEPLPLQIDLDHSNIRRGPGGPRAPDAPGHYSASGDRPMSIHVDYSTSTLRCTGIYVDEIADVVQLPLLQMSKYGSILDFTEWKRTLIRRLGHGEFNGFSILDFPNFIADTKTVAASKDDFDWQNWKSIISRPEYRHWELWLDGTRPEVLTDLGKEAYMTGENLCSTLARTLCGDYVMRVNGRFTRPTDQDVADFWRFAKNVAVSPLVLYGNLELPGPLMFRSMMAHICNRVLFITKMGFVGVGPPEARVGDLVSVLYGCSVPVVLRREGQGHTFVGESMMGGLMDGEALLLHEAGIRIEEEFVLQ